MRVILTIVCLSLTFLSCSNSKKLTGTNKTQQGITGFVKEITGNRMPGPGRELPPPTGIRTTIYVYEITNISQVKQEGTSSFYLSIGTKLVTTVESDEKGQFTAKLPPGNYSLFTKVDGRFYANSFDTNNNIAPALVEENKFTEVEIMISDKATF